MSHSDTKFVCDMCHYHTDHHKFLLRHQRIKHASIQVSVYISHCIPGFGTLIIHSYGNMSAESNDDFW
jgi:hypothetical protein